jgi:LuxR family maltose regulon positive regulatory protein
MLLTKLHIPSPGKNLVLRERLSKKLSEGLDRKLILISAPAGFGKTTAIIDWITRDKIPAAWVSIDRNDNDPVEFLSYFISAIRTIHPGFGLTALEFLRSSSPPEVESIINILINEIIDIETDFLLVFDDFHLISNAEISQLLAYLIDHAAENLHIAILTRSDPALPIARLRSQYQLLEIRAADLCFSAYEISILFNKRLSIKLSDEDAKILEAKTEGWIAGLQLTALTTSDQENISELVQTLKGDNRYIMDYLIEEVLKIQSDDIQAFLLKTSILEQISAPLCNQLLSRDDSQLVLEKLEKGGMFMIPLDRERQWYRYHHLFADLLKQRLFLVDHSSIKQLHAKACDWYEQNGMYNFAIEHALKINNYQKGIAILNGIVESMWENGKHSAILKYGELLPDEILLKNPNFCFYYAWILITAGEIQKAESYLVAAENMMHKMIADKKLSRESRKHHQKLFGKISVAFAYLNSHLEHSDKIFDYCSIAMENLSEEDTLWYSWAWFSIGIANFSKGDLIESKKAFDKAFEYGKKTGNIYLISTIVIRMAENEQQLGHYQSAYQKCTDLLSLIESKGYSNITKAEWTYAPIYLIMGVTQLGWADLDEAYKNIKIAYYLSKKGKDHFQKLYISIIYSILLQYHGEAESVKLIDEVEELMRHETIPPFLNSFYITWKIYLLMDQNQIDQAIHFVSDCGLGLGKEKNHANEIAYSAFARLLIRQGKLGDAELLLSELYAFASANHGIDRMIELKITFTTLYQIKGEKEKAIQCLMEALEMASHEEQLFDFVFWSERIKSVLREVYKINATTRSKIPQKFIEKLRLAIVNKEKRRKNLHKSDLSARENDTLKLIAENLTNSEIAGRLFISVNTVKTHLKNIYLKLDVDSRTKAIEKAKALQLI